MSPENLLAVEPLLIARLKEQVAEAAVQTAADLAGVQWESQITPAVNVIYHDYRVAEEQAEGRIVRVEQRWWTVVTVRNARDTRRGDDAREDAGALGIAVIRALAGWKPGPDLGRLRLQTAPAPARWAGGFGELPLLWSTRLIVRGADSD